MDYIGTEGDDVILGGDEADSIKGLGGNDELRGGKGADVIEGGDGNDILYGNGGNDELRGGAGNDTAIGGNGNDSYYVASGGDVCQEDIGGGWDSVYSWVSYTLASEIEELHLQGSNNINGTGNESSNLIIGNSGNNVLRGGGGQGYDIIEAGAGADSLYGGYGDDRLTGGAGADKFVFDTLGSPGINVDDIFDFESIDTIVLDNDAFAAIGFVGAPTNDNFFRIAGTGLDANDRIIYNVEAGYVYYDPDGSGDAGPHIFAILHGTATLTYQDFLVIE